MVILNVPGDFMCVNVILDTSCEVSDIIKRTVKVVTNRCGRNCDVENKKTENPWFACISRV